jgi:hypothetical protein
MAKGGRRDLQNYPGWLHHELMNWSRWCWLGAYPHPLPSNRCASIEREYIPVGNAEKRVEAERKPIPPNEINADLVQRVWRKMDDGPRLVLRAEYPQRNASGRQEFGRIGAARCLHMCVAEYERHLCTAIGLVWDVFEGRNAVR